MSKNTSVELGEEIWRYTVDTWGDEQAERYVRLLNESFRQIAANPNLGRSCDPIRGRAGIDAAKSHGQPSEPTADWI